MSVLFSRSSCNTPSPPRQQGFTLVEMLIVIVIIGVVAAFAAPNLQRALQKQRLNENTQTLSVALREARAQSQMRRQDVIFAYKTDQNVVELIVQVPERSSMQTLRSYHLSPQAGVTAMPNELTFRANKTVRGGKIEVFCDKDKIQVGNTLHIDQNGNVHIEKEGNSC